MPEQYDAAFCLKKVQRFEAAVIRKTDELMATEDLATALRLDEEIEAYNVLSNEWFERYVEAS